MKVILRKDITTKECPWLYYDLQSGTDLYIVDDIYGVVSDGVAASFHECGFPYFEIPKKSYVRNFGAAFSLN